MAIPPLHARDTYILSPNCNLSLLPLESLEWQREFPLAPPLPNFLAELSVLPRPYKQFCPSKVHRPLYLRMLAWLMRGGWVTQLCTFAYIVVWPEILYEVDYEMEAEELDPSTAAVPVTSPPAITTTSPIPSSPSSSSLSSTTSSLPPEQSTSETAEAARLDRIRERHHREAADKATAHARKLPPTRTKHPSVNDAAHLASIQPHIIHDAKKATGKESRYLSAIARRFEDEKVRNAWISMSKYFDGHTALERIALQEDMKRKEAWTLLTAMSEYLICTRHW